MRKSDEQSKPSGRQSRKRSGKPFILTLQIPSHFYALQRCDENVKGWFRLFYESVKISGCGRMFTST